MIFDFNQFIVIIVYRLGNGRYLLQIEILLLLSAEWFNSSFDSSVEDSHHSFHLLRWCFLVNWLILACFMLCCCFVTAESSQFHTSASLILWTHSSREVAPRSIWGFNNFDFATWWAWLGFLKHKIGITWIAYSTANYHCTCWLAHHCSLHFRCRRCASLRIFVVALPPLLSFHHRMRKV